MTWEKILLQLVSVKVTCDLNERKKKIETVNTINDWEECRYAIVRVLYNHVKSGSIDQTKSRYHVLLKILGTCRSMLSQELCQIIIDKFMYLYNIMLEQGQIPEDVFNDLRFPGDNNVHGSEVLRNAGILQKSYQQSKCLTH